MLRANNNSTAVAAASGGEPETHVPPMDLALACNSVSSRKAHDLLDKRLATYAFVFDHGSTGLTLEEDMEDRVVHFTFVSATDGFAGRSTVQVGDIVYKINGIVVLFIPYKKTMELLRMAKSTQKMIEFVPKNQVAEVRCLCAEAQRAPRTPLLALPQDLLDKKLTTYAVAFDNGPMGLNLQQVVRKKTGVQYTSVRAIKGIARTRGVIQVGDILYKVNGAVLLFMPYDETMELLRAAASIKKTLEFVPKKQVKEVRNLYANAQPWTLDEATLEMERAWGEAHAEANLKALKALRCTMPVDVRTIFASAMQATRTPNGKQLPLQVARRLVQENALKLLRLDPMVVIHEPSRLFASLDTSELTVTERRALNAHFKEIGPQWKAQQCHVREFNNQWVLSMRRTLMRLVDHQNRHVLLYGPTGNHRCPLVGKRCPLVADMSPQYGAIDYGFPQGDVFGVGDGWPGILRS